MYTRLVEGYSKTAILQKQRGFIRSVPIQRSFLLTWEDPIEKYNSGVQNIGKTTKNKLTSWEESWYKGRHGTEVNAEKEDRLSSC